MKKRVLYIVIASIVVVGAVAFILKDRIVISFKDPSQKVSLTNTAAVCDQVMVRDFEKITASEKGYNQDSFNAITNKIKSAKGYEEEPVCNYILLYQASTGTDKNRIKQLKEAFDISVNRASDKELLYKMGVSEYSVKSLLDSDSVGRG